MNEASYEEIQIDDDSTHQHCSCVTILNAEKEVLNTENAKLSDKCASLEEEVDTLKLLIWSWALMHLALARLSTRISW